MEAAAFDRALAAAVSTAAALDLTADDAIVLQDSTRLTLRLMPCDVVVRLAPLAFQASAELEIELARRLVVAGGPVAALEPRVEPRTYVQDGFVMNLWTFYESVPPEDLPPVAYAAALERLHAGLRQVELTTPLFTDRVAEAHGLVKSPERSPQLTDEDRELLSRTMRDVTRTITEIDAAEQLLHGEPHPGNVLGTTEGPLFIDLETCCRGPVEFDLAHVPEAVSYRYPGADVELLGECRALTLAMVASWRWDGDDHYPDGLRAGRALVDALRDGPPWPSVGAVWPRSEDS